MSSEEPSSSNSIGSDSVDYFKNDRNIRILSRRNETTRDLDPAFDEAFESLDKYMRMAFDMAYEALEVQEVPVGCVFVYKNEVIARGRNRVNEMLNGTLHAEIVALRNTEVYCKKRGLDPREVMKEVTLYVNLEPCQMCAAAMQLLNVPRIFFGACNDRFGGVVTVGNIYDYMEDPPQMDLISGIGWKRTVFLLQAFYSQTNPKAPENKRLESRRSRESRMKTFPLVVNAVSVLIYGYVFYFDYDRPELDGILPIPGNQWTKFMFLTFCNLLLQFLYHSVGSILALTAKSEGCNCPVQKAFDFYAVSIAFPLATTVVGLFWGMYFISPELLLTPEGKVICSVAWYNHAIHTVPLFAMILDFIAWRHAQPVVRNSLLALAAFIVLYLSDVHFFYYYTNVWAYPIMRELNTPARLVFFGGCAIVFGINYFLGFWLNSFLAPVQKSRSQKKKN